MKGSFITIEGPDGSGKTTALHYVAELFRQRGYEVVMTREPGGCEVSEKIRTLVLQEQLHPITELLLFGAARAQHIHDTIKPALRAGKIVLCDRFSDSTYAYQGAGRGYAEEVTTLEKLAQDGFEPDMTLFMDVSVNTSEARLSARSQDGGENNHFDKEQRDFKRRVHAGFGVRYVSHKQRMYRIDAEGSFESVQAQLRDWVEEYHVYLCHRKLTPHLSVVATNPKLKTA